MTWTASIQQVDLQNELEQISININISIRQSSFPQNWMIIILWLAKVLVWISPPSSCQITHNSVLVSYSYSRLPQLNDSEQYWSCGQANCRPHRCCAENWHSHWHLDTRRNLSGAKIQQSEIIKIFQVDLSIILISPKGNREKLLNRKLFKHILDDFHQYAYTKNMRSMTDALVNEPWIRSLVVPFKHSTRLDFSK